jgi:hypothetical protein
MTATAKAKPRYGAKAIVIFIELAVALVFALQLNSVAARVERAIYEERWLANLDTLDVLCDDVDLYVAEDKDWNTYDYTRNLLAMAEKVDGARGEYAALFNEALEPLSDRRVLDSENAIDPFKDENFAAVIWTADRGALNVPHKSANGLGDTANVYFRWIPTGKEYNNRVLLVFGLSWDALKNDPRGQLMAWCVGLFAISGAIIVTTGVTISTNAHRKET